MRYEFEILNPNGMKDTSTVVARPDIESIVAEMQKRDWHVEDGLYVAVQKDGYRWYAFRVDVVTTTTYVGRKA